MFVRNDELIALKQIVERDRRRHVGSTPRGYREQEVLVDLRSSKWDAKVRIWNCPRSCAMRNSKRKRKNETVYYRLSDEKVRHEVYQEKKPRWKARAKFDVGSVDNIAVDQWINLFRSLPNGFLFLACWSLFFGLGPRSDWWAVCVHKG